jgi:hypothetical protein
VVEPRISHDRSEESDDAKAVWFQSLALEERMQLLVEFSDLVFQNGVRKREPVSAESTSGRIRILSLP